MTPEIKKIIASLSSVALLLVAYYGSYLPLRKSQVFIDTTRNIQSLRSFNEFAEAMSVPLDRPSPIGQEELVRNMASMIMSLVRSNGANAELTQVAVDYIEKYYQPITSRGRGMSYAQNLYILGLTNQIAFIHTKQTKYLESSIRFYKEGYDLGPKRPQFLYGLFDVYRMAGRVDEAKKIGEEILTYWPDDEKTKGILSDYLSKNASPDKPTPKE